MFLPDSKLTGKLYDISYDAGKDIIDKTLDKKNFDMEDFAVLLSPGMDMQQRKYLAARSYALTRKRFGFAVSLYIPLYYDNRCTNGCVYCGFNAKNKVPRKTLTREQILKEAIEIRKKNFKNILLVAGEHPESANIDFLVSVIRKLHKAGFSCVSIEIAPLDKYEYRTLVKEAHLDGLYVYQETYDRETYDRVHPFGPKKDYDYRLETPERGAAAGIPRIGVGALLGLSNWRKDMFYLAQHLNYLQKYHWQAEYSISFPRIRDAKGSKRFSQLSNLDFIQIVSALRLIFQDTAMSLTTRETPEFRDKITPFGFTVLSAGSSTVPGGYSEKTNEELPQFSISDSRSPSEIAEMMRKKGFDPVWKDWE